LRAITCGGAARNRRERKCAAIGGRIAGLATRAVLLRVAGRGVLQHPPEFADVTRALRRIDGDGLREDRLDRVSDGDAHRSRRRPALGVERAIGVFADVLAFDGRAVSEELDHQHGKRVDVGLRTDRSERVVKLLGRRIRRREHPDLSDRRRARTERERMVRNHLGDAEIEDLELGAAMRECDEDVRWIQIAVNHPLRVGEGHCVRDGIEQADDLLNVSPSFSALPSCSQLLGQREALEPLEHHVRHEGADRRRHGRAGHVKVRDVGDPRDKR
jgi:hypothetical protein